MKKSAIILSLLITYHLSLTTKSFAQIGTWSVVTNAAPNYNAGVMLLLTDGSVICHNATGGTYGTGWDKLTPDIHGSYANGTWTTIKSMTYDRIAFSSQVLPSGKVYVGGGEYGPGGTRGELYDPVANTWSTATGVPSGWNLYDGNSQLLYNGNVLEGPQIDASHNSYSCLFYNSTTNSFSSAPTAPLNHDEAAWLKLPDSSVLFVGISTRNSCRYIPQTNNWLSDANCTQDLYDTYGGEAGPAFMLPNGKAIFFGATQYNQLYNPTGHRTAGTWSSAANFPKINGVYVTQPDAPGAMMVNGHILLAVSPIGTSTSHEFNAPVWFLEYDYVSNTFTRVTGTIPVWGADSMKGVISQQVLMLNLPDGSILVGVDASTYSSDYLIYTPGGSPIAAGKPTINSIIPAGCPYYKLTGTLFNGISEGSSFGDDWEMPTNYPIIRLTDGTNVYYARTTNWNRIGAVQTGGLLDTTTFTLPSMPGGTYSLVVTCNGFASDPVSFTVFGESNVASTNVKCNGGNSGIATVNFTGGVSPYSYVWTPSGQTTNSATGLSAGTYTITATDNNGCTASQTVVITQAAVVRVTTSVATLISCNGASNGAALAHASSGSSPYTYSWSNGETTSTGSGLSVGIYTVTIKDSCGNSATATVNITQPTAVAVTTDSVMATSGCNGQAKVVVSGGTAPYTYSWAPTGQTNATATSLCAGTYCCYIRDNRGCSITSCVDVVTGIDNLSSGNSGIYFYPNPTNGKTELVVKDQAFNNCNLEIYDVLGELVFKCVLTGKSTYPVDLSGKSDGVYLYKLLNNAGGITGEGKIVVEK